MVPQPCGSIPPELEWEAGRNGLDESQIKARQPQTGGPPHALLAPVTERD